RHTRFSRDWSSDVCSSDLLWFAHTYSPPASAIICAVQLSPCGAYQISSYIAPLKTVGLLVVLLTVCFAFSYSATTWLKKSVASSSLSYKTPNNFIHSAFPKGVYSTQSPL